ELERRLDLCPIGVAREELGRREDGAQRFADVPIGASEGGRGALDERRRRRVADEAACELGGDEAGGGRAAGEDVQYLFAVLDAASGIQRASEKAFFPGVVQGRPEDEAAA